MAKGNLLMNTASGKLGSMVIYRAKGEQRVRTYVKTVANPKTTSQMGQRTQLSNLVSLYRVMKVVLNNAFTDKKPQQSDYNAFVSRNLNTVNVYTPKAMAQAQGAVVAPYQISSGSIAAIEVSGTGINAVTNLAVGKTFQISEATTVAQLSKALISNNEDIIAGMQLSYISVFQNQSVATGYPYCTAYMYKLVLNLDNPEKVYNILPPHAVAVVNGFLGHGEFVHDGAFAWILSQKDSKGKLNVSPQRLIVTSDDLYLAYSTEVARDAAGTSYGETPDPFLRPSGDSNYEPIPVPSVASLLFDDTTSKEGMQGPVNIQANSTMTINGSNLADSSVAIFVSDSLNKKSPTEVIAGAVAVDTFLSNPSISATRITGKVAATHANIQQVAIVIDGVVMLQHVYLEGTPDPGA